ncbi:hypothetical protein KJZ63_01045 [Patescibacteria group bacterium]|nr:hypothetical protein [Patescibacteria group bacterium]
MPSITSKELAKNLLDQRIIDISDGFPVVTPEDYMDLASVLFHAGVFRVPIVGFKTVEQITTLALVSTEIQEHRELAKIAQLDKTKILFTASLEGYPFSDFDPFYAYLKIILSKGEVYQRVGRGSDYFSPPLSGVGVGELSRIFAKIGTLMNV